MLLVGLAIAISCLTVESAYPWPDNVTQIHGYLEVNQSHGDFYFFWLFESRNDPASDPLVVWLTGGPGCSSMLALFSENGPFLIPPGKTEPVHNPYSWNSFANLMFVDQPPGTGFTYTTSPLGYAFGEKQIAKDLWNFLQQFYYKYPKYSSLELFVIGESYAGHYVSAFGAEIVNSDSLYAKNLKGIGIGNGWVNPLIQFNSFAQYAYQHKMISDKEMSEASSMYKVCRYLIEKKDYLTAFAECPLLDYWVMDWAEKTWGRSINPYDIRKMCLDSKTLCYNFTRIDKFLARDDIRAELGIPKQIHWKACKDSIAIPLIVDGIKGFQDDVAFVLEKGRRVLVYSGVEDYVCNYIGGQQWTLDLAWSGKEMFANATAQDWHVDGVPAGRSRSAQGLTFLEVFNAGHMVPMDQPNNALQMLDLFIHNNPFNCDD